MTSIGSTETPRCSNRAAMLLHVSLAMLRRLLGGGGTGGQNVMDKAQKHNFCLGIIPLRLDRCI